MRSLIEIAGLTMSDAEKTEMLAEMGLNLISQAYASHPEQRQLDLEDALGLRNVPPTYFTDQNYREKQLNGPGSRLFRPLIESMISDGIFHGHQAASGLSFVTLAAHVRAALRVVGDTGRARSEAIDEALENSALGKSKAPHGAFTAMARIIGFEP